MTDHYLYLLTIKNELFRKLMTYFLIVYVPKHTFKRLKRFKPCNDSLSKIAGMPDFITIFEVFKYLFIQPAMCVRYQSNSCHTDPAWLASATKFGDLFLKHGGTKAQ